jgi:hypothetical protein
MSIGVLDVGRLHAREPRLAIEPITRGGRAAAIHANDGMVDRRPFRPELHRADELLRWQVHRKDYVPVHIARTRRERVGARHGDDEIGLAEFPARRP